MYPFGLVDQYGRGVVLEETVQAKEGVRGAPPTEPSIDETFTSCNGVRYVTEV
jgi:hypothetical protein